MPEASAAGTGCVRRAGDRDLVLEVALGDAGTAPGAPEGQQAAHVGRGKGELARLVGLPVLGRGAAGFAGHVRGEVVLVLAFFLDIVLLLVLIYVVFV